MIAVCAMMGTFTRAWLLIYYRADSYRPRETDETNSDDPRPVAPTRRFALESRYRGSANICEACRRWL